jgi:hypothetical protein
MQEIRDDAAAIRRYTSQILARIDRISDPLPAGESPTQGSEDWNDSGGENDRVSNKYSILFYLLDDGSNID